MGKLQHINLKAMAARLAAKNPEKAAELVPLSHVMTTETYLTKLEDALRHERISIVDEKFRIKWAGHMVFTR